MDSTTNQLFISLIVVFCFLIGLIIFLPIYGYIIIFKNLYHEKHYVLASLVPIYHRYKEAEYTFGKKFGYVGVMLDVAIGIYYFFLNLLPYGTIPAYDIIGLVLFVFNMWFCVMMFSRITKSTRLIAIGPAWSIDRETEDNDEDDDKEED